MTQWSKAVTATNLGVLLVSANLFWDSDDPFVIRFWSTVDNEAWEIDRAALNNAARGVVPPAQLLEHSSLAVFRVSTAQVSLTRYYRNRKPVQVLLKLNEVEHFVSATYREVPDGNEHVDWAAEFPGVAP